MAIRKDHLVSARTSRDLSRGYIHYTDGVLPGLLNPIVGAPKLPHLTPLVFVAGAFDVWTDGDEIDGFLIAPGAPDVNLQSDATDQVMIEVLRMGRVHAPRIAKALPTGQSQAALETALKSTLLRQKNLVVSEIEGVA